MHCPNAKPSIERSSCASTFLFGASIFQDDGLYACFREKKKKKLKRLLLELLFLE